KNGAAGIAGGKMRFVRDSGLIESGVEKIFLDARDQILPPAFNAVAPAPAPADLRVVEKNRIAALRPAPDHDQSLPDFIGQRVKRRVCRKSFGDFENPEITRAVVEPIQDRIGRALVSEDVRLNPDVLNGDE